MRSIALPLGIAVLAGLMAGCAQVPPTPEDAPRPTIVSLNPCSDAVLAEVTAPGQLIGISHYSHDPASSSMEAAKAARYASVSGSLEEIVALDPDIVVTDPFMAPALRSGLERLGIRVETVPIAGTVDEARGQIMDLARIAGDESLGVLLTMRIDMALMRAAGRRDSIGRSALVWQAGGIVPGEGALISDLLARTGFISYSAARGMGQADYLPLEQVLADPPQLILIAGDGRSEESRLLAHPALDGLTATERRRFDPSLLWCGGPTIERAAQRLKAIRIGR